MSAEVLASQGFRPSVLLAGGGRLGQNWLRLPAGWSSRILVIAANHGGLASARPPLRGGALGLVLPYEKRRTSHVANRNDPGFGPADEPFAAGHEARVDWTVPDSPAAGLWPEARVRDSGRLHPDVLWPA